MIKTGRSTLAGYWDETTGAWKMMDMEERTAQKPAMGVPGEDLSLLSLKELHERVAVLEAEIIRCREVIADKEGARSDAESFFRK